MTDGAPAEPRHQQSETGGHGTGRLAAGLGQQLERWALLIIWVGEIALFGVLRPELFLTTGTFQAIFGTEVVLLIASLALLIPLTIGEFDLSVAGTLGIAYVLMGSLNINHGWPLFWAIAAALLAGALVGLVNAFFVVVADVQSIVVTLGTGTVLGGLGYKLLEGPTVGLSQGFVDVVTHRIAGLPLSFYAGLTLTAIVWYVFAFTPLGRYLFFVGANRSVSRLSGIRVDTIRTGAFVAAGVVSAFAGVVLAGSTGAADSSTGGAFLLPVFAAAFLGATTVTPGRFNAWGTFIAVYFLATGVTGLQLVGLTGWAEQVFYGSVLVLAVTFSRLAGKQGIGAGRT
jgi:ribose transport system permease protein